MAKPPGHPINRTRQRVEIWTEVSGVTYGNDRGPIRSRQKIIRKFCREGTELWLCSEPKNLHSDKAIGLWVQGRSGLFRFKRWHQVGYVLTHNLDEIHELASRGWFTTAHVWKVVGGPPLAWGLRINIYVHPPELLDQVRNAPADAPDAGLEEEIVAPVKQVKAEFEPSDDSPVLPADWFVYFWYTWIPSMPPPTPPTYRTAVQLAFFEGIAFAGIGIGLQAGLGRSSDLLPIGVVMAVVAAGIWGILVTFFGMPPRSE